MRRNSGSESWDSLLCRRAWSTWDDPKRIPHSAEKTDQCRRTGRGMPVKGRLMINDPNEFRVFFASSRRDGAPSASASHAAYRPFHQLDGWNVSREASAGVSDPVAGSHNCLVSWTACWKPEPSTWSGWLAVVSRKARRSSAGDSGAATSSGVFDLSSVIRMAALGRRLVTGGQRRFAHQSQCVSTPASSPAVGTRW